MSSVCIDRDLDCTIQIHEFLHLLAARDDTTLAQLHRFPTLLTPF